MKPVIIAGVLAILVAACASKASMKSEFAPDQVSFINTRGEYSVSGQAFLKRKDGQVVYAAGSPVTLIPKSKYADEFVDVIFKGGSYQPSPPQIDNLDPRFRQLRRNAVANGEGRFRFDGLAAGTYYLMVPVTWEVPQGYTTSQQGGLLLHSVSLPRDEGSEIVITH